MGRNNKRHAFLAISLLIFAAFRTSGFAAEKIPFYQGKTLNIVINFAAGGPTDIESRIFARHLLRHIPGQPTITVQNMGGGGGLIAVNYIGEVAKPDGLTAAYFTGALFQQQIKDPALRVDLSKFGFITGVHGVTVSYIRSEVAPGIKKPSDFVKAQKFRAAGLGVSSSKDVRFRLSFDLLGLKYDYVTGYNNSSDARLAVQRNEAQYHDETLPSYRTQVEPQMVKTGMVTPLYYTDLVAPSGEILVSLTRLRC
jgi:putative tricarboxylic transport membrane protein